jgi:hypothetical protein
VSKRTITIVGVTVGAVVILALYALIVRGILSEREQQDLIEMQIEPLESALTAQQQGSKVLSDRQVELATLQAELEEAQFAFPSAVDSTQVWRFVYTAAEANQTTAPPTVRAHSPTTTTLGGGTYSIFAYDVEVEGDLAAIANFIEELELGPVETLALDQILLEAQPPLKETSAETPAETPASAYRATLVIQVYVRR